MQFINLTTGALDQVDMAGMQRIKLAEHHPDGFVVAGKFQFQKTVQRFQLLSAGVFDLGIQQLAEIALGHTGCVGNLLKGTPFLADGGFQVIKR